MAQVPKHLLYTHEHEWILQEGDIGTVGITDYAQSELSDIVFVELPQVQDRIKQGEPFGTIEAVKAVADLYAPASGEVIQVNESLEEDAGQVNTDPYGSGWMIKIRLEDPSELENVMSADAYQDMIDRM